MNVPGSRAKVIEIKIKNRLKPVSQFQLEEFLLLSRQLKDIEERWNNSRLCIADSLSMGAEIEPGVHHAHLEQELIVK